MGRLSLLFYSEIRAELLRLFFGLRSARLYLGEIERMTGFANRSIEEELKKLAGLQLLTATRDGNRVYYTANRVHPLYPELHNIVLKTDGLHDVLADALAPDRRIEFAFIFGSVAQSSERAESDLDLMIVGDLGQRDLATLLKKASESIGREINPHVFSRAEFGQRMANRDHFLTNILNKPTIFIKGNENEFADLAGRGMAAHPQDKP